MSAYCRRSTTLAVLTGLAVLCSWSQPAQALIMIISADQPWHGLFVPRGCDEVANLPGRLGGWEGPPFGGGEFHFSFRCKDTDEFNTALKTFAAIRTPRLELAVHDGPGTDLIHALDKGSDAKNAVNWTFVVWQPVSFHQLFSNPKVYFDADQDNYRRPVPAPRIDVYVDRGGPIAWSKVKVPPQVQVIDERAEAAPVKPAGGGLLEVNVYDMASGQPVADTVLILSKWNAESRKYDEIARSKGDQDGRIRMEKLPTGTFSLRTEAPGYASRACGYFENKGATYRALNVEMSKTAELSGYVVDAKGKPIKGVKVSGENLMGIDGRGYGRKSAESVVTDEQGRFKLASLPTGFASVRCESPSYFASGRELHKVPSNEIRITMVGTGGIRGKVTVKEGQKTSDPLHVHVVPRGDPIGQWGGSMECKPDGSFEFNNVPAAEYFVSTHIDAAHESFKVPGKWVTVESGKVAEVEVPAAR